MTRDDLIRANQERWDTAIYKGDALHQASLVARRLVAPKARAAYQRVEAETGVPWWVVAVIHEREASQRWDRSIAQGDPWNRKSIHVPKGRGPFPDFFAAAKDALINCHPYAGRWTDWSPGGALTILEMYNGLGYQNKHNMASPYIWSGTQHYSRGKYIADGQFDPNHIDRQLGCSVLINAMMELDHTIGFKTLEADEPPDEPPEVEEDDVYTPPPDVPASPPPPPEPRRTPKAPDWLPREVTERGLAPAVANRGVKSLVKSKINWIMNSLGLGSGAALISSDDSDLTPTLTHLISNPKFLWLVIIMILVGTGMYFYWRDHGKGSL